MMVSGELPTGTITFLFADVEASTQLFEQAPERIHEALIRHDTIIESNAVAFNGFVVKPRGEGDSRFIVFKQATAAIAAAVQIQQDLFAEPWETPWPLRVRIALHTGEADLRQGDYYGSDVNRCARLRGIGHGGQTLLSGATCALVQDNLPPGVMVHDEGVHRLKGLSRPEHVYQLIIPDLLHDFPPLRSLGNIPNNLPLQLTKFIGRKEATTKIPIFFQNARLLTIVGPGGMGKSRLAVEVAAALAEQFNNGVFFVPLAPLTDEQHIVAAIGESIGFRNLTGGDLRQGLLEYLRNKQLLLIMDNFEHVLASADMISEILQVAPEVKILCTSRERLNLSGEAVYPLSGLNYPADPRLTKEEMLQYDAVRMLLDRTRLVRPDLQIGEEQLVYVAQICRLVQGMPLALVLAAGWLEMLSFEEVAEEISASLDILESETRDLPLRHHSVRATFEYSWQRLGAEEKQVFSRLAVFRGGFTRAAALKVAGAGLRSLRTLAKKSLIATEGANRYAIHELLRQFAEEKLEAAGQSGLLRDAHKAYYLEAVAQREADLKGQRQLHALEEIDTDLDNVRMAWARALDQEDGYAIDHAQESLALFFRMQSRNQEGWSLFSQALQSFPGDQPQDDSSRRIWGRLTTRSRLLHTQFAQAAPEIEEDVKKSLAIAEGNADQFETAYSYLALGYYHSRVTGNYQQALESFMQSLERYKALGDLYYVAHTLHRVGYSHGYLNNREEFLRHTRQSMELARQIGDLIDEAYAQLNLGADDLYSGEYDAAERKLRESNALSRRTGDRIGQAHSLVLSGLYYLLCGRLEEAEKAAAEGVTMAQDSAYSLTQAYGLAALSVRANLEGNYELGNRLAREGQALITNPTGEFLVHWAQAIAFIGLEQTKQAGQHARTALSFIRHWSDLGLAGLATWMLPVVSLLLAVQEQPARAVEMLSLYDSHPARPPGFAENWPLVKESQVQLKKHLGSEAYQAAWERGKNLDLLATVDKLLSESQESPL